MNKHFLITAGPTYEKIDPVRFIGNFSSGKMGFAIAERLAEQGARVSLIAGPVALEVRHPNIKRIDVMSACEMYDVAMRIFPETDGAIMAAAVADYRVKNQATEKIKRKASGNLTIELEPNPDIAAALGGIKKKHQILVGFALETQNEIQNAQSKLSKKNLDFIVLNSLKDKGSGFGHDTNKVTIIDKDNNIDIFELKSKKEVSLDIVNKLLDFLEP